MTNTLACHDNLLWETIICIERKLVNLINARKLREREKMEQHALKNVNNCLNTNIYSNLETSGGQSFNP